jgi:3-oxoacyl-[acyl-carrier protein] reductase
MTSLTERVALVTGVSRGKGIGAALARRLAADGATLFLTGWSPHDATQPWGVDEGGGEQVRDELRAQGHRAEYVSEDLADPAAPARCLQAARDAFGHVDMLVINHARSAEQRLEDLTADELDACYAINARAALLLVQAYAAQHDDSRSGGRVVWFTSGQYHGAMPDELPYIASKAVVQQLTASLAVHLAPRGVTVNCVDPGPNDTGYAEGALHDQVAARLPMGRWGQPEDAARLVAWLVSDSADWVTGQTIASDGGWSALGQI